LASACEDGKRSMTEAPSAPGAPTRGREGNSSEPPCYGALDLGTNNCRLLIARPTEEGFTVIDSKTGMATTVAYPQVKSVKGNNLSTGAKIAIGVGIGAALLFIILWFTTGPGSD